MRSYEKTPFLHFETVEDMMLFFRDGGGDAGILKAQERPLHEFFQEEFEEPRTGLLTSTKRDRVSRGKVQAAIAKMSESVLNPHDQAQMAETIYSAFSGYVHGAYPHIMELYGGMPPAYHMAGVLGTPRMTEMLNQLVNQAYRGVLAAYYVSKRLGEEDVAQHVLAVRHGMDKRYPGIASDPKDALAKLKKKPSD